jgi:hypothetical protein
MSQDKPFCNGYTRDFVQMWATIESAFPGSRLGVKLDSSGCGVVQSRECRAIAAFLNEAADWLDELEKPSSEPRGPIVYAIADGEGRHKIGKAVDIRKRIKQLQTGNAKPLKLVAYLQCDCESLAIRAESQAHAAIADCRVGGEWFDCDRHTALQALYEGGHAAGIERHPVMLESGDHDTKEERLRRRLENVPRRAKRTIDRYRVARGMTPLWADDRNTFHEGEEKAMEESNV